MVNVNNLTVQLNGHTILKNISVSLLPGRITCFIGKSGAGKTTLLKSLVNLVYPTSGEITINGQLLKNFSPKQKAQTIGYVFQQFNLFTNLTVLENCTNPLSVHGMNAAQAHTVALKYLEKLGMAEYANVYPSELSGGQQQRVAIARSLCLNPRVLLLDEPTASLDPINTQTLVTILKMLAQDGFTIGVSSQDMHFVRSIIDRVYYLENGEIANFCDNAQDIYACTSIMQFIKM